MAEPMTDERFEEIRHDDEMFNLHPNPNSVYGHRRELVTEVKRLHARLAEYTHWEPTVKEEYEHACQKADRAEDVVKKFEAGGYRGDIGPFLASLKHALEM